MSKLLQALSELLRSPRGRAGKGKEPEPLRRSEFRRLIQQEFTPAQKPPRSRSRSRPLPRPSDPDTEPMNEERAPVQPGVY